MTGLSSTMNAFSWLMGCPLEDGRVLAEGAKGLAETTRVGNGKARVGDTGAASVVQRVTRAGPRRALRTVGGFLQGAAAIAALALLAQPLRAAAADSPTLVVGSKRFTESYILGEILAQTLVAAGVPATHKPGLGNTGILEQALASGAVDLYPEYPGTIV